MDPLFQHVDRETIAMRVHHTWKVVGLHSLLEVVHGQGSPGSLRLLFGGCDLKQHAMMYV